MLKKIMFPALAIGGAAALTFSIYFYQASLDPDVIVVEASTDRFPAGTDGGGGYVPPPDENLPPAEEPPPDIPQTGGKDAPPAPARAPAPAPAAPAEDCISKTFVADSNSNCTGCVKGVNFSSSYIASFMNAAYYEPYSLRGTSRRRLAIMGIISAGYCPSRVSYAGSYPRNVAIHNMYGNWRDHSVTERASSWRRTQRANPLFCETDKFEEIRKKICEVAYRNCNLWSHIQADCYGRTPDRDNDNDNDRGGTTTGGGTNGGTTGEREVGEGTNEGSGHGADRSGGQGDGPPGTQP